MLYYYKAGFSIERYALSVYNEICMALEGLVIHQSNARLPYRLS